MRVCLLGLHQLVKLPAQCDELSRATTVQLHMASK